MFVVAVKGHLGDGNWDPLRREPRGIKGSPFAWSGRNIASHASVVKIKILPFLFLLLRLTELLVPITSVLWPVGWSGGTWPTSQQRSCSGGVFCLFVCSFVLFCFVWGGGPLFLWVFFCGRPSYAVQGTLFFPHSLQRYGGVCLNGESDFDRWFDASCFAWIWPSRMNGCWLPGICQQL